jgi:hypothetical protein
LSNRASKILWVTTLILMLASVVYDYSQYQRIHPLGLVFLLTIAIYVSGTIAGIRLIVEPQPHLRVRLFLIGVVVGIVCAVVMLLNTQSQS